MDLFNVISVLLFGLIFGSFFNVIADRTILGQSIVYPPSHCPDCGTKLKSVDLIPIISWIFLKGRCRYCGAPISIQYPLVEVLTALLWGWMAWRFGWSWETLIGLILVSFLIPLSVIDLREWILPDKLTYPLFVLILAGRLIFGPEPWWWYVGGSALGAGFLFLLAWASPYLFGKEGMGLGDVKLMAGIGAAVGLPGALFVIFLAALTALVLALVLKGCRTLDQEGYIPFGPFLSLGGVIVFLYGDWLWNAYRSLLL